MADDIITRDGNGDLAVNTVVSTEANVPYNYDDCFTLDTNGRRALRVVGAGGGGDSHNKGYFATQSALEEAYPTGEAGDYAIVGATDTVWLWDEDNSEWVDSDQKGQVTSVNGQTGDVTLMIPDAVQYSAMPQASSEEVGNIYQYVGITDANYTNGYFYKCVSDGQDPATYSWERVDVQPAGVTYTAGVGIDITNNEIGLADTSGMPAQDEPYMLIATEDSGTGEVTTSWSSDYVKSINSGTGDVYLNAESVGAVPQPSSFMSGTDYDPRYKQGEVVQYSGTTDQDYTQGYFYKSVIDTSVPESATLGTVAEVGISNVALNSTTFITAVGSSDYDESYTFDWNDTDGEWYLESSGENVGSDLTGYGITYDGTPTDGDSITVEYTAQGWKWEQIDVQPSGGGSYLPLSGGTITGEVNIEKATDDGSQMLRLITHSEYGGLGFRSQYLEVLTYDGSSYYVNARYQFASSGFAALTGGGVLGEQYHPWSVFYLSGDIVFVDSSYNAHTISLPATTGTMVVADYTGASQGDVLTLDSNGNAVWQAGGGGSSPTSLTITLPVADWVSDEQTVTATGMTSSSVVFIGASPTSVTEYNSCGVICTAQATNSLTFTCTTTPVNDLMVNVLIM